MGVHIEVTNEAQTQVRELIKSQKPGMAVRVYMQAGGGGCGCGGGGCGCGGGGAAKSGPSFGMAFDKPRTGDEVVKVDGFSLVMDPSTASQIEGAKIDYVQSLDATGFKIVPANAPEFDAHAEGEGGCGCGSGGCSC
jgi:Fe-S cluster assembly iron-binding protein IscA